MSAAASQQNGNKDSLTTLPENLYDVPYNHRYHASYNTPAVRNWQNVAQFNNNDLMYPLFIADLEEGKQPINSLPEQYRWGINSALQYITELYNAGLRSVLLFGVINDESKKTEDAYHSHSSYNPVSRLIPLLRKQCPNLLIACDICLCAYTTHGHCGILNSDGSIDNIKSIHRIAEMSVHMAKAGAHIVAPSDMMDGRSGAIKAGLRYAGLDGTVSLMTYSAKFASCLYGPFRDAASSGAKFGDRQGYQLPIGSRNLAIKCVDRDIAEGSDYLIIKPSIFYLDIVRESYQRSNVPLAVYQVSGEYSMIWHAAQNNAFDLKTAVYEHMNSARRAGATILITYYTPRLLKWLKDDSLKQYTAA